MKISIVIPAYKCKGHILSVLGKIPQNVSQVYVVDDACPEKTGEFVSQNCSDSRVKVLFRFQNGGVGAAMKTGYEQALQEGFDIVIKVDGDDQMDLGLLPKLVDPIIKGYADYTKGNRFFYPRSITRMPKLRIFGNAVLGFLTKLSSGYYSVFDPTNGYTAIHINTLKEIELEKLHDRYFFESDLLFRLNLSKARVMDIPMRPIYGNEKSSLNELRVIPTFLLGHCRNFYKRIIYNYFLRDFSIGSVFLAMGMLLSVFGVIWSGLHWYQSFKTLQPATTGTVMIGVLAIVLGFQLLLSFIINDISSEPKPRN